MARRATSLGPKPSLFYLFLFFFVFSFFLFLFSLFFVFFVFASARKKTCFPPKKGIFV